MKMGVLGSGMVAQGLSARLAELGHNVVIGTRDAYKLRGCQSSNRRVLIVSFAETAAHGDMLINATNGTGSLNALTPAGEQNLAGKILIDVSNPLDFTNGFSPSLMELLRSFGWIHIFDLGDLSTARGTEAYLLLWVRLYGTMNTGMINVKIMK